MSLKTGWLGYCIVLFTWVAAAGQTPEKKLPIPDKAAEAKAMKVIMLVFGEDIDTTKDPAGLSKLADDMLRQADRSKSYEPKDDPANRYVLYREARDLAARAGSAELAMVAIDDMAREFDVDALGMKTAALTKVAEANLSKKSAEMLAQAVLGQQGLIQEAIEADRYDLAQTLTKVAEKAAEASADKTLPPQVLRAKIEVRVKQKSFSQVQSFIDRLEKDPRDAEANFELGKYYALLKGHWDKGLAYLAKGGDHAVCKLAAQDLKRPKDAHERLALADGWWNLAAKEKGKEEPAFGKDKMLQRAAFWYKEAEGDLSGLNRTKARKRGEAVIAMLSGGGSDVSVGPLGEIKKFEGHTDDVKSVAFSADGRLGASGSNDQTVRIWDLASGKEEKILRGHKKQIWSVAFRDISREVLSASWDATVRLWDVKSGADIRIFNHRQDVNGLALSRDGNFMLTACDDRGVYLWNVATGEEVRRYGGHTDFVYCVAFSPSGAHFASGSVDRTVRVVEVATGNVIRTFDGHTHSVTNVAFAPDGRSVFSCGDGAAHQWDLETGKELRRFEHKGKADMQSYVFALAVSSDGRRLFTGGDDKSIRVWEVASGKQLEKLLGHTDSVTSLALSPDGHRLLSGSLDRTVRLWGVLAR